MAAQICCVDHERAGTKSIGGRWFCDEHYDKAMRVRSGGELPRSIASRAHASPCRSRAGLCRNGGRALAMAIRTP